MKVIRKGLHVAGRKGKIIEPDHALAMAINPEKYSQHIEVSYEEAIAYQAGEVISTKENVSGWIVVCYKGISMGWGKSVDGTIKNHYPKGLRRR